MTLKPEYFRINSDNFVWTGNTGACDITDLPPTLIRRSAGASFLVVSSKTGKVIRFDFQDEMVAGIGCDIEITGWRYGSHCGEFFIDILND